MDTYNTIMLKQMLFKVPEIDEKIRRLNSNGEKIFALLERNKDQLATFQQLFVNNNTHSDKKSETTAVALKVKGNKEFAEQKYLEAMKSYNQSLCYNETNSTNISIIFANRSAVYLKLGYYETALKNIQLALEHGYPENLQPKLAKRREDCLKLLNNEGKNRRHEDTEAEIKLSYKANKKIPFIVEGIDLIKNEEFGRGLIATRDFKVGDILINEKPFAMGIKSEKSHDPDKFYSQCFWCLKTNLMNLLPCKESTLAMFCSEKCYEENLKHGFKYESQALPLVETMLSNCIVQMRAIIKVLTAFKDIDEMKSFLQSTALKNLTVFDLNQLTEVDQNYIKAYFSLLSHWESRPDTIKDKRLWEYTRFYYCVVECTDLKSKVKSDEDAITVMEVLHQVCEILSPNSYEMRVLDDINVNVTKKSGSAIGILTSLLNHSCAPNLLNLGEYSIVFIASRPIKAGEQLFTGYCSSHYTQSRAERKTFLKEGYLFDCNCIACQKNFPTLEQMRKTNKISFNVLGQMMPLTRNVNFLSATDMKKVEKAFKMSCELLQKWDRDYPFLELYMLWSTFVKSSNMMYLSMPLQLS